MAENSSSKVARKHSQLVLRRVLTLASGHSLLQSLVLNVPSICLALGQTVRRGVQLDNRTAGGVDCGRDSYISQAWKQPASCLA